MGRKKQARTANCRRRLIHLDGKMFGTKDGGFLERDFRLGVGFTLLTLSTLGSLVALFFNAGEFFLAFFKSCM